MDGCDGRCANKGGRGCGGGRSAFPALTAFGESTQLRGLGCLVCWSLACLMGGWMDGWSVNNGGRGWMHAWMHKWMECK